jgi:hypothetical protein
MLDKVPMPFYWYPYEKPTESSHLVNKAKLQVRGPSRGHALTQYIMAAIEEGSLVMKFDPEPPIFCQRASVLAGAKELSTWPCLTRPLA